MIIDELFESPQQCPECGGISFSDLILAEKKDACYYKVKASAKVWPSAYASGRLVQCRKKGAANYGNKSEGVAEGSDKFAMDDEDQDPEDHYSCYDCGSTIFLHHTKLCDLAEPNAIRDLPAEPGTQYWTGKMPKGMAEGSEKDMSKEVKAMATGKCPHCHGPVEKKEHPTLTQYHCAKCGIRASIDKQGMAEAKFPIPQDNRNFQDQADYGGEDPDARDQYGNLKRSTSPGLGGSIDIGGVSIPAAAFDAGLGSVAAMGSLGGMKGIFGKSQNTGGTTPGPNTTSTVDLGKKGLPGSDKRWAYQSNEPSTMKVKPFGEPGGEPVNPPAVMRGRNNPKFDPNLSKTDPGKTIAQREQEAADLLAKMAKLKVQQGKPRINAKDYEAHLAKQKELQQQLKDLRAADVAPPTLLPSKSPNPAAAQTSDSNQVPTIKLPNGQTIPDPARVSPSGQYGHLDKIARDDERAVDAMVKKARENAQTRDAAQANKEKQLGLEPGSLRPRSQWEQERAAALRSEEQKLGLPPGSLSSRSQRQPEQTTTLPGEKENSGMFNYIKNNPKKSTAAAAAAGYAADELLKDKKLKEQSRKKPKEVDYDAIDHDKSVARLRHLAGIGPMKTVWDPARRVYKNVPTADQPPKK